MSLQEVEETCRTLSFYVYKEKRLCGDRDRGAWWVKVLSMRLQKSRGIIHWDLTLSNLLCDENQVKISDLGLSNEHSPRENLDTFCCTAAYTPLSSSRGGAAWAHLQTCGASVSSCSHGNLVLPLRGTRFLAALTQSVHRTIPCGIVCHMVWQYLIAHRAIPHTTYRLK